jgi:hypothetical protein
VEAGVAGRERVVAELVEARRLAIRQRHQAHELDRADVATVNVMPPMTLFERRTRLNAL